jgi:hypothetical protein
LDGQKRNATRLCGGHFVFRTPHKNKQPLSVSHKNKNKPNIQNDNTKSNNKQNDRQMQQQQHHHHLSSEYNVYSQRLLNIAYSCPKPGLACP